MTVADWRGLVQNYDGEVKSEQYGNGESQITIKRVSTPDINRSGIRFQRCGGGVRVIRKRIGGAS